jgi:hypothetical protein
MKPDLTLREFQTLCDLDLIRVIAVGALGLEPRRATDPPEVVCRIRQEIALAVRGADLRRCCGHGVWTIG